jgi:Na+-translocating ferredoxin:NAD+ oxidoreductase RnfC subunit
MSGKQTIVRVDATGHLRIAEGDRIRRGDTLSDPSNTQKFTAPVSGVVESIQFDGNTHEFVIVLARVT